MCIPGIDLDPWKFEWVKESFHRSKNRISVIEIKTIAVSTENANKTQNFSEIIYKRTTYTSKE